MRKLRGLDADIAGMQALTDDTHGLWAGDATKPHLLAAALRFATALRAVQEEGTLQGDHGEIAASDCGVAPITNDCASATLSKRSCVRSMSCAI